jgi:hypothetical protein
VIKIRLAVLAATVSDGCSEGRTLVVDNGRLAGIISPSDISGLLQRSQPGTARV